MLGRAFTTTTTRLEILDTPRHAALALLPKASLWLYGARESRECEALDLGTSSQLTSSLNHVQHVEGQSRRAASQAEVRRLDEPHRRCWHPK